MSTVIITVKGTPTPGDVLMLSYTHPIRGGASTLQYKVRQPVDFIEADPVTGVKQVKTVSDTITSIVDGFVAEFSRGQQWPLPEFEVTKRNDSSFVVKQQNAPGTFFDGIVFKTIIEGANGAPPTETMEIEVL
jgi:hypothetical protein